MMRIRIVMRKTGNECRPYLRSKVGDPEVKKSNLTRQRRMTQLEALLIPGDPPRVAIVQFPSYASHCLFVL